MNATEIKKDKRYLIKIGWNEEGIATVVEPKSEKVYGTWKHKVVVHSAKGSKYVYNSNPQGQRIGGGHYEEYDKTYDPPHEMLLDSHSFKFPLDENDEKIMTATYLRKQNEQVAKLMAEAEKAEKVQEFILNMALAGVECWQSKDYIPSNTKTDKWGRRVVGSKGEIICFKLDDFETVNKFVGGNLDDFLSRIAGEDDE